MDGDAAREARQMLTRPGASPIELRTPRLHLRPFRAGDVADALAYRDDPEFARFLPHVPQPFTKQDAEAFVAGNMAESWETSPVFAVMLGGVVIGTVNFEVDPHRGSGPTRVGDPHANRKSSEMYLTLFNPPT